MEGLWGSANFSHLIANAAAFIQKANSAALPNFITAELRFCNPGIMMTMWCELL
jgi:hypothetical protein